MEGVLIRDSDGHTIVDQPGAYALTAVTVLGRTSSSIITRSTCSTWPSLKAHHGATVRMWIRNLQPQARSQIQYLKTTGGTMTGSLRFKNVSDSGYWTYIISDTPKAWVAVLRGSQGHSKESWHCSRYWSDQQLQAAFKIQGRSNKQLLEVFDDGKANVSVSGDVRVSNELSEDGHRVATQTGSNTFTENVTFNKYIYAQTGMVFGGKKGDLIYEIKGEHDNTKNRAVKIRGSNRLHYYVYPGQDNVGYKSALTIEWDKGKNNPLVMLDYLQEPQSDQQAATKAYVDKHAGGGSIANSGSTTPSLKTGELFFNTTDKICT